MEPCTKSVNLGLDRNRQSRVPMHECMSRPPQAGQYSSITLHKIVDCPVSFEELASYVVKQ
jgi:hypothetical protein